MSTESKEQKAAGVGIPDIPIEDLLEDEQGLQIGDYALALAEFIKRTETPMTIGLQGDWGSGKTSLMNLISARLDRLPKVWVNTWKYSQTDAGQALSIAVFMAIIHKLSQEYETRTSKEKRREFMGGIAKALVNMGGKFAQANIGVNIAEALAGGGIDEIDEVFERYEALEKLKEKLSALVNKIVETSINEGDRIIVFIDDLDRVPPERAVEILEILKVFLDIKGLVFVLACDYEVILQGLRSKGELAGEEVSGRSFFDKIIQVPFQMPSAPPEKLGVYIGTLLRRVGAVQLREEDVSRMVSVLERTTGTNPRTIKRLINIVNLLLLVLDSDKHKWDDDVANKAAIVFTLVALQNAYPAIYTYLSRRTGNELFSEFSEELLSTEPLLKQALDGKDIDTTRLNEVLTILRGLVDGDSELLLKFIRVSDIAVVQEKTVTAPGSGPTRFAKKYIEKQPEELRAIIYSVIAGLPRSVTYHGSRTGTEFMTARQSEHTDFEVHIKFKPEEHAVDIIFSADETETLSGDDSGPKYLDKLISMGCPEIKATYADWKEDDDDEYINCRLTNESSGESISAVRSTVRWFLVEAPKLP